MLREAQTVFERYRRWLSIAVVITDVVLINLAFAVAYWLRYGLQWFAAVDEADFVSYSAFIPASLTLTLLPSKVADSRRSAAGSRFFDGGACFDNPFTGTLS